MIIKLLVRETEGAINQVLFYVYVSTVATSVTSHFYRSKSMKFSLPNFPPRGSQTKGTGLPHASLGSTECILNDPIN